MNIAWDYEPSQSAPARIKRRMTQWRRAARALAAPDRPVVTFTFDDFPKLALNGADILEKANAKAGFYACTSLMGQRSPVMGDMFDPATLAELAARGHEIGAHTHDHLDCGKQNLMAVERDIGENLVVLSEAGHTGTVSAFAWPFGEATFAAKLWIGDVFGTARGTRPGVNRGEVDRTQLRAVELTDSAASRRRALAMLKNCIATKGWLVFFTHDVSRVPSPYGTQPALIEELVQRAVDDGAVLAPPTLGAVLCGVMD